MSKPSEILLFDFLTDQLDLAVPDDVLFDIELHDTIYQPIIKPRGIRISDATGSMAPGIPGEIREYDVSLQIVCFAKVVGKDKKQRQTAVTDVFDIQKAVYRALIEDGTLGGRVCDVMIEPGARSYDVFDANPYAVAVIPVIINPGSGS